MLPRHGVFVLDQPHRSRSHGVQRLLFLRREETSELFHAHPKVAEAQITQQARAQTNPRGGRKNNEIARFNFAPRRFPQQITVPLANSQEQPAANVRRYFLPCPHLALRNR